MSRRSFPERKQIFARRSYADYGRLLARSQNAVVSVSARLKEQELAALPVTAYRHLERIARLAFLDPAIIRAILAGTQPRYLSARTLWRRASLPLLWVDQRRLLRIGIA